MTHGSRVAADARAPGRGGHGANALAPGVVAVLAALALFLLFQYAGALREPFFSDDYIFLDKVRDLPLAGTFAARELAYGYWRPWSRELHYWTLERAFGPQPLPFHAASFALWLGVMSLYYLLARRIAGGGAATLATCGLAALAAWGLPLRWSPAAQDLWMMLFALLALLAFARRRTAWACAAFALALLSKEQASAVPAIAFVYAVAIDRDRPRAAVARLVPLILVLAAWTALHPALGGRWWWARDVSLARGVYQSPASAAARSLLAMANLDLLPAPERGWPAALIAALPGAAVLAALAAWGASAARREQDARPELEARTESDARRDPNARPGAATLGLAWAVFAWTPLALPFLIWQPYYVLFGAMGAWLAIAVSLRRRPVFAVALIAALALVRVARADTPSRNWGSESLQRSGKRFMAATEAFLRERHPALPRHSRLYFAFVPRGVVFVTGPGDAPALRVWYGPTTRGSFWSSYAPRTAADSVGPDLFFRFHADSGWYEVIRGPEEVPRERAANPRWQTDHERLAMVHTTARDFLHAAVEYEKLAAAFPDRADYAYVAGLCRESIGETDAARRWYVRAASLPGADEQMLERARTSGTVGDGR